MTVQQAIEARRSIRKFKPDPVSDEDVMRLMQAARLAPSGTNHQPWRFYVIKDNETKKLFRMRRLTSRILVRLRSF